MLTVTTIFVPLVQAAFERSVTAVAGRTWLACCLALLGVAVIGVDTSALSDISQISFVFSKGDALMLGAAFLYSLHVVRLGRWANEMNPLTLSSAKSVVQAVLSSGLIVALVGFAASSVDIVYSGLLVSVKGAGTEILQFFGTFSRNLASGELPSSSLGKILGATVWSGVVGTAYVLYAQSLGQQSVRPSDANLVYSLQPVFTALFAYLLLGETMSSMGFIGGSLILGAVYLVASKSLNGSNKHD